MGWVTPIDRISPPFIGIAPPPWQSQALPRHRPGSLWLLPGIASALPWPQLTTGLGIPGWKSGISEFAELDWLAGFLQGGAGAISVTEEPQVGKRKLSDVSVFIHRSGLFSNSIRTVVDAVTEFFVGFNGYESVVALKQRVTAAGQRFDSNQHSVFTHRRHLPQRILLLSGKMQWPLGKATRVFQLLEMPPYSLSLCEIRQGCRLSEKLRVPMAGARGGPKRSASKLNRSPGLPEVCIQEFEGYVDQCLRKVAAIVEI